MCVSLRQVAPLLANPHALKVTYRLKSQLKNLAASQSAKGGGEAVGTGNGGIPLAVAPAWEDVRISAWLLEPDKTDVIDGSKVDDRYAISAQSQHTVLVLKHCSCARYVQHSFPMAARDQFPLLPSVASFAIDHALPLPLLGSSSSVACSG
jgi:hypothetical protein